MINRLLYVATATALLFYLASDQAADFRARAAEAVSYLKVPLQATSEQVWQ
jgi:hypothetical protein